MARSIRIPCPQPPAPTDIGTRSRQYAIHVITPLFGGGVEAGKNDPITLIRGASIRGQLRFWWRASRGAKYRSVEDLQKREAEIWGTSKSASPVSIDVRDIQAGKQERCAEYQPDRNRGGVRSFPTFKTNFPSYALFPFQGKAKGGKVEEQPATATWTASFNLLANWPEHLDIVQDVEAAIWAWVNFGGLGARTRRGCGALFCEALAPSNEKKISEWYAQKLKTWNIELADTPRAWPTLPAQLRVKSGAVDPMKAWSEAVKLLQDFRQGQGIGRNPGLGNRPGRSRWPEADSLRRITGMGSKQHKESITTKENAFPRAELGLPIVFHFQNNELPDCELYPQDSQRMASPLILKPLTLGQKQALPMVMCLNTPPLDQIELKKVPKAPALSQSAIRHPDLATYDNSPMKNKSSAGSALEAFIAFAEEKGFR